MYRFKCLIRKGKEYIERRQAECSESQGGHVEKKPAFVLGIEGMRREKFV